MKQNSTHLNMSFKRNIFFVFVIITSFSFAQSSQKKIEKNIFENPVILSHYSLTDLKEISPQKREAIYFYFTQSYILDSIACSECRPFSPETFDVSKFEQFRKQSERYIRTYSKYGFKLTLLSKDELENFISKTK